MRLTCTNDCDIMGVMKTQRLKHAKGYWLLHRPNHPHANKDGYVPEQRLVIERAIGRYVNPLVEDVHHRDGGVTDNTLANLILLTKAEHRRLHAGWKLIDGEWWKTCNRCGRFLLLEGNFYRRHKGHNQYVSMCKDCICQIGAENRPPRLSHEQRSLVARRGAYKGWKTRKQNKQE